MDAKLTVFLKAATAQIEHSFFLFPIMGGGQVFRERVYCYELYHQLRCVWKGVDPYVLNGEVDKKSHPFLKELKSSSKIPDFLVHTPGAMAGNFGIIEVKPGDATEGEIKGDLEKLTHFIEAWQYKRAILLLYGENTEAVTGRVRGAANRLRTCASIEIWHHAHPKEAAQCLFHLTPVVEKK